MAARQKTGSEGFVWDPLQKAWNRGFAFLSAYKEANGNCRGPKEYKVEGFNLGTWIRAQSRTKTSMTKERLDKPNSLGFVWKVLCNTLNYPKGHPHPTPQSIAKFHNIYRL